MKKNILIVGFTDHSRDPRILKQIEALKEKYNVFTLGIKESGIQNVKFFPYTRFHYHISRLSTLEPLTGFLKHPTGWFKYKLLKNFIWLGKILFNSKNIFCTNFDLIIANDIETLPFVLSLSNKAKILLDAHEYSPRQFEDNLDWVNSNQGYLDCL